MLGVCPKIVCVNASERVMVYGATGHTGRFVIDELPRRGLTPVLAVRSTERLAAVASQPALDVLTRAQAVDTTSQEVTEPAIQALMA